MAKQSNGNNGIGYSACRFPVERRPTDVRHTTSVEEMDEIVKSNRKKVARLVIKVFVPLLILLPLLYPPVKRLVFLPFFLHDFLGMFYKLVAVSAAGILFSVLIHFVQKRGYGLLFALQYSVFFVSGMPVLIVFMGSFMGLPVLWFHLDGVIKMLIAWSLAAVYVFVYRKIFSELYDSEESFLEDDVAYCDIQE